MLKTSSKLEFAKPLQYLCFRLYEWQRDSIGESAPEFTAVLLCSIFQIINFGTFVVFFQIVMGQEIEIPKLYFILITSGIAFLNFWLLTLGGRFDLIKKRFENEPPSMRRRHTKWCWAYVIMTHGIFFISAFFLPQPHNH